MVCPIRIEWGKEKSNHIRLYHRHCASNVGFKLCSSFNMISCLVNGIYIFFFFFWIQENNTSEKKMILLLKGNISV